MITNIKGNNAELCDFYNDPKRRERENDYINKETFPTLDLSIEGIQESISKVWDECQQGQELLEEIDRILTILYSKISAFSSSNNACFSLQSVSELDSLVKEYEIKRSLIYETLSGKINLKSELELLYLDFIKKQFQETHIPLEGVQETTNINQSFFSNNITQMSSNSCSDWSMINEIDQNAYSSGLDSFEDDDDQDNESMILDMSISGSHSTNFEYIHQTQEDRLEQNGQEILNVLEIEQERSDDGFIPSFIFHF
ncbi:hypothetical protein [Cryptosporidium parvum Iowa II]|uniref:Uncharacterized protein n=2 Tax=Cryptosporidium parvum TaxID=5807 RepID=Q5CQQ6_CRYPI|nr:hypothetical protein [Cryptosporidium parvum Iowa II]EAK87753.1 hypothetical protein cgd4_3700 [Cryptosporidium parvum Iowa II]QOY42066.1 Uncharacterized protein CPATCC_0018890 [Cryptosporidium parvum]WKS77369.1 hypothetical protein CPCDC_4g3700 [Cryptosporidium sp. 43IA8]WRK31960.1 Uncharacterized protein cpbgf_4003700 [Cryptosporidium parvum]|eukprot:QOY42066.1 hypothetical protein CPATCC_001665 [Cryptosporidium parvum]